MNAREFTRKTQQGQREASKQELRLARQYESAIRAAAGKTADNYRRAMKVGVTAAGGPGEERTQPPLDEVLFAEALAASATARTRATRRKMAKDAAVLAMANPGSRALVSPMLEALVMAQAGVQAERLVAGTRNSVASIMLDALTNGWTVPQTAEAIQAELVSIAPWQGRMLARTDLISLANGSSLAAAQSLGEDAPPYKTWISAGDDKVRPDHVEASGQTVPNDQPFSVGGAELMYPGDPQGGDSQCINCRCTQVYADTETPNLAYSGTDVFGEVAEQDAILAATEEDIMPWHVEERDDEYCVIKDADDSVEACHATEAEALDHVRALYAAEDDVSMSAYRAAAVTAAQFTQSQRERLAAEGVAMEDGSYPIRNTTDLRNAIQALGRAKDPDATRRHIIKRAKALNAEDMLPEDWNVAASAGSAPAMETVVDGDTVTPAEGEAGAELVASVAPLEPPAEWFTNPGFTELTPLTVDDDGRVFGHIASWDGCHTGIQGRCVTPPRGITYDFFNVGVIDTEDGTPVKVGGITAATGHAPLTASRSEAVAHYDNTGTVVAYVHAGEDEFGPWVAGALKSDATPEQVRDLKANGPSGDWRGIRASSGRSKLELVGVLAVPVQGFPIPRAALAAAGADEEVVALIAGMPEPEELTETEFEAELAALAEEGLGAIERRLRVTAAAR